MNDEDHAKVSEQAKKIGLRRVEQLMEFWLITPREVERFLKKNPLPVKVYVAPAIKYRHPVTDLTWDGTGPHPDWLRKALLQEGYTVAELHPDRTKAAERQIGGSDNA